MIHLLRQKASAAQVAEMLEVLNVYIKVAVDIEQGILAGGGALHADCEAVLLEAGSQQSNVWGADWIPSTGEVRYEALINIRPSQGNLSMTIQDPSVRDRVKTIVELLLGGA
jgi:uncharacterized protein DUF5674